MKIILAIFCGLMVLFAGGCALILVSGSGYNGMFQSLPMAVIPGGIAALNVLVLLALFGARKPQGWAFYVLAVVDVLVDPGSRRHVAQLRTEGQRDQRARQRPDRRPCPQGRC